MSLTTREAIIHSATKLWYERGYGHTTLEEIVQAAGLTKGAFYRHFRSKDGLLRFIHEEFVEDRIATVRRLIDKELSPGETLTEIVAELVDGVARYREAIAVLFREMYAFPRKNFSRIEQRGAFLGELILSVLNEGIRVGEFRRVRDPRLVMFGIIGMCASTYEWFDIRGPMSGREVGEMYADLILKGLRHGSLAAGDLPAAASGQAVGLATRGGKVPRRDLPGSPHTNKDR